MSSLRLLAFCPGLAIAVRADAATLTVTTDKPFYAPGETVTITTVGNSGGATDVYMFGALEFDPAALLSPASITLPIETGTSASWISGILGCAAPVPAGSCWILNHIHFPPDPPLGMDPIEQTLATITATAGAPGLYSIEWSDAPGLELYFFGLTGGPGAKLVISNTTFQVTPEPRTALLIGLGLIALGTSARRFRVSAAE